MTNEAEKKYWICCSLCDNDKYMKGTDKCEAEKWEKEKDWSLVDGIRKKNSCVC